MTWEEMTSEQQVALVTQKRRENDTEWLDHYERMRTILTNAFLGGFSPGWNDEKPPEQGA